MNNFTNKLAAGGFCLAIGFTAMADTIYDDASLYNGNALQMSSGLEVGNEISISPDVWSLTNFSIQYYSPAATLNSQLAIDVRFYLNDGAPVNGYATPGTLFFDSGYFYNNPVGNIPGGSSTINYTTADFTGSPVPLNTGLAGNLMPGDFTFTITFANIGTNVMSLPLADSQAGTSYGDYWLYDNVSSQWTLLTNTVPANFVVDFSGVPEPSPFYLGAIGSVLLFGIRKLKRKS